MASRTRTRLPWPGDRSRVEADASFFENDGKRWPRPDSPDVSVFTPEEEAESHKHWRRAKLAERFRRPMSGVDALGFGISAASVAALSGLGLGRGDGEGEGDPSAPGTRLGNGDGDAFAARKTVVAGDLEKPAVTTKHGGSATQVFQEAGADTVFANPLLSRVDTGYTVRRVLRGSGGPFDGRASAGGGTERGADAAPLRKADAASPDVRGPLVADAAPAVRAPMDAAGAAGIALVMRPEAPEPARAEEREQVAAAKQANASAAEQHHAAAAGMPAETKARDAAAPVAAVRAEAHTASVETDNHGGAADPAAATDTEAAGHAKGEASETGARSNAHGAAAVDGNRDDKAASASDEVRAKDAPTVETKADPGRGTVEAPSAPKAKDAPLVAEVKGDPDHGHTVAPEHTTVKDASVLIGAGTLMDLTESSAALSVGKTAAKDAAAGTFGHAQAAFLPVDPVKAGAALADTAAQSAKAVQAAAADQHTQAAKGDPTGIATAFAQPVKTGAALADTAAQSAKAASPAVDTHGQPAKAGPTVSDLPPQFGKAAVVAADTHDQPAKAAALASDTHDAPVKAGLAVVADTVAQAAKAVPPAADGHAHPAPDAVGHDQAGPAAPAAAAFVDQHSQPLVAAPAHVQPVEVASAAAHTQPVEVAPVVTHAQPVEAVPSVVAIGPGPAEAVGGSHTAPAQLPTDTTAGSTPAADTVMHFPDLWTQDGSLSGSGQPNVFTPDALAVALPPPSHTADFAGAGTQAAADQTAASPGGDAGAGIVFLAPTTGHALDGGTAHPLDQALLQFTTAATHDGPVAGSHSVLDGFGSTLPAVDPSPPHHATGDAALL